MGVVHKVKRAAAAAESQMNRSTASLPVSASSSPPISKYPRFGKRGAPQAFPSKLYEILEGENPDIVGWTPTGRGFEVRIYLCRNQTSSTSGRVSFPCIPRVRGSVGLSSESTAERRRPVRDRSFAKSGSCGEVVDILQTRFSGLLYILFKVCGLDRLVPRGNERHSLTPVKCHTLLMCGMFRFYTSS